MGGMRSRSGGPWRPTGGQGPRPCSREGAIEGNDRQTHDSPIIVKLMHRTSETIALSNDCSVSVVVGRRTSDREIASSVPGRCIAG